MTVPTLFENLFRPLGLRSRSDELWPELWTSRLFEQRLPEVFSQDFVPPINVAETEKTVVVTLEVPGMTETDLNVELMGNQLTISGEKKIDKETKGKEFHRIESHYGKFSRSVTLPKAVRTKEIDASCAKGLLTITIPKLEETPATKVKIRGS